MDINERNIKMWSTIGARATFGVAALEFAKKIENHNIPLKLQITSRSRI